MFQSFKEVEDFFTARKKIGIKLGLERIHFMLEKLHHPEQQIQAIHVAGTNGKGSTIQFIKNALIENKYKIGLFTSPSFQGICGHFLIDNEPMKEAELITITNQLLPIIYLMDKKNMHPTEFEIITVMAFVFFKERVDLALIETGMGGTYDTTNCFMPILSLITNIAVDHQQFLGNTIEEIATHKAGIIKDNRAVVIGNINKASEEVILSVAEEKHAQVFQLHKQFTYEKNDDGLITWIDDQQKKYTFKLQMQGEHQVDNAALAWMALMILQKKGFIINWEHVTKSMGATTLPGRFEVMHEKPTIIVDSAHNVAGINAFLQTVNAQYKQKEKHVLFAGFKDKQLIDMIDVLHNHFHSITITTFSHERAATWDIFEPLANRKVITFEPNWQAEIKKMFKQTDPNKVFFITGSLHFITLVRHFISTVLLKP